MAHSADIETILEALIGFDTTSHKSNLALIDYIKGLLDGWGVPYELVPDESLAKASLFARIGPIAEGGIGLSGHTDVVPVTGQNWATDPFKLTSKGTRLYGRGTTDMKGFLACMLAAVPGFLASELKRPIYLIFSYDEEIGCTGVRPLIEELGTRLPMPELVLVGEPTNCQVVEAHKSITSFVTTVTGFETHSSVHHLGVSSIEVAAKLINFLTDYQVELARTQNDPRFDPAYSTVHVGRVTGGTARNIVAKTTDFLWEVRALPGYDGLEVAGALNKFAAQELLPSMRAIAPSTDIETIVKGAVPGLAAGPEAIRLGMKLANQNMAHVVSYGTEAGLFNEAGAASVICGPGNISEAHKPDEFIERDELEKCMAVLERVAAHQSL
ncbi:MAG: acetylornithine deacetylase [Rhodomicrobium sp.]|nr:MAG: acetylornithine deacetylase [Rhodomicrobium sp.]